LDIANKHRRASKNVGEFHIQTPNPSAGLGKVLSIQCEWREAS
jgi:hypothetical protein